MCAKVGFFPYFCPIIPRDNNSCTKCDSVDEPDHQKYQISRGTDRRQGITAKKIANDQRVCRIIQLLKQISDKQRNRKKYNFPGDASFRHSCFALCIQKIPPLSFVFYLMSADSMLPVFLSFSHYFP